MSELARLRGSERYGACADEETSAPQALTSIHATTINSENGNRLDE